MYGHTCFYTHQVCLNLDTCQKHTQTYFMSMVVWQALFQLQNPYTMVFFHIRQLSSCQGKSHHCTLISSDLLWFLHICWSWFDLTEEKAQDTDQASSFCCFGGQNGPQKTWNNCIKFRQCVFRPLKFSGPSRDKECAQTYRKAHLNIQNSCCCSTEA